MSATHPSPRTWRLQLIERRAGQVGLGPMTRMGTRAVGLEGREMARIILPTKGPQMSITSTALTFFSHAREALAKAHAIDEVKNLRDKAQALLLYSRQARESLEMQNLCAEIKLRAERRAGELLSETTIKGGERHKSPEGTCERVVTLPENISKKQSHKWQTIAALPEPAFEALIERGKRGASDLTTERMFREAKQYLRASRQATMPPEAEDQAERYRVAHCDIGDALQHVAPSSIDVILTDPPYGRESLPLYESLGVLAATALKPGGSLLAMVGQAHLPAVLNALTPHLRYQWTLAYLIAGQAAAIWNRSIHNRWKPILWLVNGTYTGGFQGDVLHGQGPDKEHHMWGQDEAGFAELVKRFSFPGDTVLDLFCGGGTTGVAAIRNGRRFIGLDNGRQAISTTRARLSSLQALANRAG
jgi:16S rRNA G966 N2-methylase RsmD